MRDRRALPHASLIVVGQAVGSAEFRAELGCMRKRQFGGESHEAQLGRKHEEVLFRLAEGSARERAGMDEASDSFASDAVFAARDEEMKRLVSKSGVPARKVRDALGARLARRGASRGAYRPFRRRAWGHPASDGAPEQEGRIVAYAKESGLHKSEGTTVPPLRISENRQFIRYYEFFRRAWLPLGARLDPAGSASKNAGNTLDSRQNGTAAPQAGMRGCEGAPPRAGEEGAWRSLPRPCASSSFGVPRTPYRRRVF